MGREEFRGKIRQRQLQTSNGKLLAKGNILNIFYLFCLFFRGINKATSPTTIICSTWSSKCWNTSLQRESRWRKPCSIRFSRKSHRINFWANTEPEIRREKEVCLCPDESWSCCFSDPRCIESHPLPPVSHIIFLHYCTVF